MTPMTAVATQKAFDKKAKPAPTHYLRRHPSQRKANGHLDWQTCEWGHYLKPKSFADAEKYINGFNDTSHQRNSLWEYKLPLYCERCYTFVKQETYPAIGLGPQYLGKHVCLNCHMEGKEMVKPKTVPIFVPVKATVVHKEGDIWKLPKSNSPMWTDQWGYQGSSKTPYIISHNSQRHDGSTTDDGWACSCPNFTRHTPRTPCKHILNVKLKEGIGGASKSSAALANTDDKTMAEFKAWQREKAANKTTPTAGNAKLAAFGATGRKFR